MFMKKYLFYYLTLLLLSGCHSALVPDRDEQALPFDPDIAYGRLDNGLRYYIMPNDQPAGRVYIRLVVNAGSMNEEDDQKGVAHIVEHMAFNGTRRFPQNQIIDALERLGMKFARDINAFTDFENTVYTLNLANNDPARLALAFEVINEWMNHVTVLPDDLAAERGVVLEEWRSRLSPMLRLGDKKSALEMAGSRYVLRDPIGDVDVIKTVSARRVKDFYRKWYRPDNMAVIVVGDIDKRHIKALLNTKLAASAAPLSALENIDYRIPLINRWRLATIDEAGISSPSIELSLFTEFAAQNTRAEYRAELIRQILIRLVNVRLQQWENRQSAVSSANFYQRHPGKYNIQHLFSVQLSDTRYQDSITALFGFIADLKQQGFSEQELQDEIARLQKRNERQLEIRVGSLKLADDLIPVAANEQVSLNPRDRYELNRQLLATVTPAEVNADFRRLMAQPAKLLLITQPYPAKKLPFNVTDIERQWEHAAATTQKTVARTEHNALLPPLNLPPAPVSKAVYHPQGNITEFTLHNGSRLIYHYSDKQPGQVYFKALTDGGLRSVAQADYHRLRAAVSMVDETGIGTLSQEQMQHLFTQKQLVFSTLLNDDYQGFVGVGKTDALETLMTLFRLKLAASPISPRVWQQYKQETAQYFADADKETEFMQAVAARRYPGSETVYSRHKAQSLNADSATLSRLYQSMINGKTDFTYFIIGDVPEATVKSLAEKYLANVEVKRQHRTFRPLRASVPAQRFVLKGLTEPRAEVELYLTAENHWRAEDEYLLEVLADIMQEKLRITLREQQSGIYSVNTWLSQEPHSTQIEGKITFSCAPERADALLDLTHRILDQLAEQGVSEQEVAKKRAEKQIQIKQQFDSLLYVAEKIEQSYRLDHSPRLIYLYQQLDQIVTKANLDSAAARVLKRSGRFEAILTR